MKKKFIALMVFGVFVVILLGAYFVLGAMVYEVGDTAGGTHTGRNCATSYADDFVVDTDYSDGQVLYLYGAWEVVSPQGNVVDEQGLHLLPEGSDHLDVWTGGFVLDEVGNYTLRQAIFYANQTFDESTNTWVTVDSGDCIDVHSFTIYRTTYTGPSVEDIMVVIQMLYDQWLNN